MDVTWSHVILGLNEIYAKEINQSRNNIISIICYSIYATWVKCGDTKESFKYQNLTLCVTNYLIYCLNLFKMFNSKLNNLKKYDAYVQRILVNLFYL